MTEYPVYACYHGRYFILSGYDAKFKETLRGRRHDMTRKATRVISVGEDVAEEDNDEDNEAGRATGFP